MKKLIPAIAAALLPFSAQGAVITTTEVQSNGTFTLPHTFTPSATDLINGLMTSAQSGTFNREGSGGTPVLTNGAFPSPLTRTSNPAVAGEVPFQFGAFATAGVNDTTPASSGGLSLTYTLPTPSDITGIDIYGGWQDNGRDEHDYSIFYSTAASPLVFQLLTAVIYEPATAVGGAPRATKVSLTDSTGFLALDVVAIRFDFGPTENGYSGYAEIDVIPEPASIGLLGIATAGILSRRHRLR